MGGVGGGAQRRFAVEQFHEEAKGEVGWDQYEGQWGPGFHWHAVTVMLAYSVVVWLELEQRRHTEGEVAHATRFPLGWTGIDVRSRLCTERWPSGSATKPSNGGRQRIGSSNSAYDRSNKVVLCSPQ
jgi:hypothetical protein